MFNCVRERDIQNFCNFSILCKNFSIFFENDSFLKTLSHQKLKVSSFSKTVYYPQHLPHLYFLSNHVLFFIEQVIIIIILLQISSYFSLRSFFQETITKASSLHMSQFFVHERHITSTIVCDAIPSSVRSKACINYSILMICNFQSQLRRPLQLVLQFCSDSSDNIFCPNFSLQNCLQSLN